MKRAGILVLIATFYSCFPARLHQQEEEVKFLYDGEGRLLSRTFTQVVNSLHATGLATITRHYDSAGKLTRETGFNHAILGTKYMLTYHYTGEALNTINQFRWVNMPVDSGFFNPECNLVSEIAYSQPDHSEKLEIKVDHVNDTIRKVSWKKQIRKGSLYELVNTGEKWIHIRNLVLNAEGRLQF